ncbi:MAG: hypothetical protein DRP01_06390 [Archaeoglobales archaeon]|nr:MAG: hypothetical protein DRP01_06390 [Archaeoglobales archaeon]
MKRILIILMLGIMLLGCSQKTTVTPGCNYSKIEVFFYYSPKCPHCEKVKPYVDDLKDRYENVSFYYCNVLEKNVSRECYRYAYYVMGVPTVVVHTGNITTSLVGERDILGLGDLLRSLACCE